VSEILILNSDLLNFSIKLLLSLQVFFNRKKDKFVELVKAGEKSWKDPHKKDLLRGMLMTACDISAIFKPWETQKKIAELVASEFFQQGDLEKEKLNEMPIAMMDRERIDELPIM
jgi:hypothetical protein